MEFQELEVQKEIVQALTELQITEATDIQQKTIPHIKAGKDVIGMSKTGSGKTAAFSIPILEKIEHNRGIQALIMAPTRELAVQIATEFKKFGKYKHVNITAIYGGVSLSPQIEHLRKADIVVGTPGRLKDHLQRNTLNLSKINCVVLDEADKMVDMGFIEDIEIILRYTPKQKQVLLFGATLSEELERLKHKYTRNPVTVRVETQVEKGYLKQQYYSVMPHEKFSLLVHLLKTEKVERAIIFCSTRATVDILARNLRSNGIKVESIHGKLSQSRRLQVINNFHHGDPSILVASAVAARGLDIKDVTHIFNYDLSQDPQEYIHRVGRTARAGKQGIAITLLSPRDYEVFQNILARYRMPVEEKTAENYPRIKFDAGRFRQQHSRFGQQRRPFNRSSYRRPHYQRRYS